MPLDSSIRSDADANPSDTDDLEQLLDNLDRSKIHAAIDELQPYSSIENDPTVIEESLGELDFELLEETAKQFESALQYVHDPVLRSKSQFVDHLEVASENLFLMTEPMLARRDPDDALTLAQANRFALESYTTNELIRQRGALQSAHRALTQIAFFVDSQKSVLNSSPKQSGLLDRVIDFLASLGIGSTRQSHSDVSSRNSMLSYTQEDTEESEQTGGGKMSLEPIDADDDDIVWETPGESPTTDANSWVDDRDLENSDESE